MRHKIALWLAAVVLAAYIPSLTSPFHFDDTHSVESNSAVHSLKNIPAFWTDPASSSLVRENRVYRPLVYTFYSVFWWVGGGATWPFHLGKIFMHFLAALAMFFIWRRLLDVPGWYPREGGAELKIPFTAYRIRLDATHAAALIATLFALHPAATECAIYISATTSLQCAAFYLWAFWFYLQWRDGGAKDLRPLILSLGLYFGSMASKEEGVTLPAVILATEFLVFRTDWRIAIRRVAPFAAAGVVLAFWILAMNPSADNKASREVVSNFSYFITQWRAWLWYMRLWVWPFDLNADDASTVFSKSLTDGLVIQALLGNILVVSTAWILRKKFPQILFGLAWFYITISPASSIVVLAEATNEHRMYLSFVGFGGGILAAALTLLPKGLKLEKRLGWSIAALMVGFFIGVQSRNRVWASSENLWKDTIEKNPTSGRAMNNLALVYMARAQYGEAIQLLDQCMRHWPTYAYCYVNRGVSEAALGKLDDAERDMKRAIELNSNNIFAHFHLGKLYEDQLKNPALALQHFESADAASGGTYADAKTRIARLRKRLGGAGAASEYLGKAAEILPSHTGLLFDLGTYQLEAGKVEAALSTFERLLKQDPSHLQGWYNFGVGLLRAERLAEAEHAFVRTMEIDPASEAGKINLEHTRRLLKQRAPSEKR